MNYATTENLAQKVQQMGNCIGSTKLDIELNGIEKGDTNYILCKLEEIKRYNEEILAVLNKQVEIDRY